jgi:hypothetical protein
MVKVTATTNTKSNTRIFTIAHRTQTTKKECGNRAIFRWSFLDDVLEGEPDRELVWVSENVRSRQLGE